jgi:competence protein ComEA
MKPRLRNNTAGGLLLLLLLVSIGVLPRVFKTTGHSDPEPDAEFFFEVCGDIKTPGVYGFSKAPTVQEMVKRACGPTSGQNEPLPSSRLLSSSGTKVEIRDLKGATVVEFGEMSAFYKITLQIPISINRENALGLTSIPGIGPKTAEAIVQERNRKGGFRNLTELLSVKGIGSVLYGRIRPFLTL